MKKLGDLDYSNHKKYEEYYQEMALKGWFIERIKWGKIHYFKKGQPGLRKYRFDVFQEERAYTAFGPEDAEEYRLMCKDGGWDYIYSCKFLNLFVQGEEEGKEVFMDREARLAFLQRASRNSLLHFFANTLFMGFFLFSYLRGNSLYNLFPERDFWGHIYLTLLLLLSFGSLLNGIKEGAFLWINRKNFQGEGDLVYLSRKWGQVSALLTIFILLLIFPLIIGTIVKGRGLETAFCVVFAVFFYSLERDKFLEIKRAPHLSPKQKKWRLALWKNMIIIGVVFFSILISIITLIYVA